ncbi:carboxymuconolactone decarboxylase family protein [Sphaerisporangium rubeum]|uniref:Putative peroxidase-related enzyme n=1 Tax=Sphaerisporangium rubeum TaxID=321317 RepID=A0A7X0IKL8_9ACTN|nr:carboxymuconolactone decarboxylase family protein [Sphaerisporangium rubeum]MBB6476710.1 putative peroxidase-related enzyme [Sphaerisporangium rubeum]
MVNGIAALPKSTTAVEVPLGPDDAWLLCDTGDSGPHIALGTDEPGIRGLFRFRPETALPMNQLCDVLLCGDNTLTRAERELIATYVSSLNQCRFCFRTHAAFAAVRLEEGMTLVRQVCDDLDTAPVTDKMRALLRIAGSVQRGGRSVTAEQVAAARAADATDVEIHDTVLIAAAFCMFNRYVDGLATFAPDDPAVYADRAARTEGYVAVLADSLEKVSG